MVDLVSYLLLLALHKPPYQQLQQRPFSCPVTGFKIQKQSLEQDQSLSNDYFEISAELLTCLPLSWWEHSIMTSQIALSSAQISMLPVGPYFFFPLSRMPDILAIFYVFSSPRFALGRYWHVHDFYVLDFDTIFHSAPINEFGIG